MLRTFSGGGLAVLAALLLTVGPGRADAPATIVVKLPEKATLKFDTYESKKTGATRAFETPPLTEGKTYSYTLTATWEQDGKPVTKTQEVVLQAGKNFEVEFKADEKTAKPVDPKPGENGQKSRTFLLTYAGTISDVPSDQMVRVWLPVPPSTEDQEVKFEKQELPGAAEVSKEPKYGNEILCFEAKPNADGKVPYSVTYKVTRREVKGETDKSAASKEMAELFLKPDARVPVDGKPTELLKDKDLPKEPLAKARMLYDLVNKHMVYDKSKPGWGQGDAAWACDSKFGNCTDFHSLFISLARNQKIPAKFEMGLSIPTKRGSGPVEGYHCWAKFLVEGKGWVPVDISEANKDRKMTDYYFGNLTEDRVTMSTGRDLTLVPKQEGAPLNFLIFPYAEIDGKPVPADRIQRKNSYEDVK
jgi:uncharacterized protein (TIGR03000 family)